MILSVLAKKILYLFKNKFIYIFMIFVATKNGRTKTFPPSSFGAIVGSGSGIRDGKIIWDLGQTSWIRNTAQKFAHHSSLRI